MRKIFTRFLKIKVDLHFAFDSSECKGDLFFTLDPAGSLSQPSKGDLLT